MSLNRSLGMLGSASYTEGNSDATSTTSLAGCAYNHSSSPTQAVKMSDFIVTSCVGPIADDTTPNEAQWFAFEFHFGDKDGVSTTGGPKFFKNDLAMGGALSKYEFSEYYNGWAYNSYDNSGWKRNAVSNAISSNVTAKLNMKYIGDCFNGAITNVNTMISETIVIANGPGGGPGG